MQREPERTRRLLDLLEERSQEHVRRCYQCDKCATGCPMVGWMDVTTNQLFQLMQLDEDEEALASNTTWLCASCYTCSVRCPNEIDIAHAMDVLRTIAMERGYTSPLPDFTRFHTLFLNTLQRHGRINEVVLMARLSRQPQDLLSQWELGWAMLRRGRLRWPTPGVTDQDSLSRVFEGTTDEEG